MPEVNFFKLVEEELALVESGLADNLDSSINIMNQASVHLIKAGGKRLRPAFALLAARFYGEELAEIIPAAVALELIHMATLVHDDVIDNSSIRRGTETVKSGWGNRVSIYAGNYVFARSLSIISTYQRSDLIDVLARASMKICEGEIIQMLSCYNVNLGLKNYLRRIERKTALLISVSCELGAMIRHAPLQEIIALRNYGYYLGMGFQITDDILDIIADEETLGKPTGSDIRQGVITLPALYALRHDPNRQELAQLLSSPEACINKAERIIEIISDSDGIDYAYYATQHFALKAQKQLDLLPDLPVKKNLYDIADFIIAREY
ncbi:MAG: polyprenyl synthetase family protein [Syntrophomonadaceae bacterium]|nr:polyprenyl synthetase family protein [Syntrophomonadaceae bacterium]MDD4562526.1 polyprenyl synthetase family protein [Syntrophomonadaceae bacterium]